MEIYLQGGCFWGSQYRTGIYYTHGQDVPVIEAAMKSLEKRHMITRLENNERSLTKACSLLINNHNTMPLSPEELTLIKNMLLCHIKYNHDLEVL